MIAGRNVLRVMRAAESVADHVRRDRPPSNATIETIDAV
jgi:hypothetical protein